MTAEHKDSLIKFLEKQSELCDKYDYVSVPLNKAELRCVIECLYNRKEPTHEEVESYCKARELNLITNNALRRLLEGK